MRVKVPTSLAGGSLLSAHKWVKSQMARTNPGGSADYTLRSIDGASLSLSDLTRSNPQNPITIEIVMAGMGGVRSNPSGVPIPTDFTSSPSFARGGNFTSTLLPQNLDPQLVERMVAQEGLFGAMQTLTILLSERSPMESMSPTTAGLLYAHSAIPRSNPSVKTPFLADVPKEMIDSDVRIMRYLQEVDNGITDVEMAASSINSAKLTAKYGLTRRQLDTFVDDVLAPFMAVAPANRGALRHINKKLPSLKSGKSNKDFSSAYAKLMTMMPTKAEQFYAGIDYGLIAGPLCVYPMLCEKTLPPSAVVELLDVASKYPDNLVEVQGRRGRGLKLSAKQRKLIGNRVTVPSFRQRLLNIFRPSATSPSKSFQAKSDLVKGDKEDNESYMELVIEALQMRGNLDSVKPTTDPFIFVGNIGGFYPTPPRRWPHQVVYSVMDTLLMSLPDIVDLEGGGEKNYESRVYRLLHSKQDVLDGIFINNKAVKKTDIEKALTDKPTREAIVKRLEAEFNLKPGDVSNLESDPAEFLNFILTKCVTESKGIIDPKYGKSIFELLFETIETAQGKYNYKIEDDDLTFALILLDYSIKMLFDDGTAADGGNKTSVSLGGLFSPRGLKKFSEQAKHVLKSTPSISKSETAMIIHFGALTSYVDSLVAESIDSTTKKTNVKELDGYIASYSSKPYSPKVKAIGMQILTDGKQKLQEVLV